MIYAKLAIICGVVTLAHSYAPGYSFTKFSGPVSGPEKEIIVDDHHHGHTVDYVAKPDYHFAYGVEDPKTHNSQSRHETRHGDAVHGEYSVLDPDGVLRTVKYTADEHNGFQAEVLMNGKPQNTHVAQPQPQYPQYPYGGQHHDNGYPSGGQGGGGGGGGQDSGEDDDSGDDDDDDDY